jgi:hypothetical protein
VYRTSGKIGPEALVVGQQTTPNPGKGEVLLKVREKQKALFLLGYMISPMET